MSDKVKLQFSDLELSTYDLDIVSPDGKVFTVPITAIGEDDLTSIRRSVPEPEPPKQWVKTPQGMRPQPNLDDPAYKDKVSESRREFSYRIIAAMAGLGIPGETVEEKAKALRSKKMPSWMFLSILRKCNSVVGVSEEEVQAQVEAFQPAAD